ncbi:MAG: hypothetical protein WA002_15495 [Candidatus Acidiferrales bacterium]
MVTKAILNPESFPKAVERTLNIFQRVSRAITRFWHSSRYEILLKNNMELHEIVPTQSLIETQSRILKRKTIWQVQFDERPLWMQIEAFWSMPAGRRLYICQTVRIEGRRRVLFGMTVHNRPLLLWAEKFVLPKRS